MDAYKPQAADLVGQARFHLLQEIDIDNVVPFFRQQLRQWCLISSVYCIALAGAGWWLAAILLDQGQPIKESTPIISISLFFTAFVLVPIHELLHAAALRCLGAQDIRFSTSWRQGAVLTMAHKFVISNTGWLLVAAAPLLGLNLLLASLVAVGISPVFSCTALVAHLVCCLGDVNTVKYLWNNRARQIFTYDDADLRRSYIYEQVSFPESLASTG